MRVRVVFSAAVVVLLVVTGGCQPEAQEVRPDQATVTPTMATASETMAAPAEVSSSTTPEPTATPNPEAEDVSLSRTPSTPIVTAMPRSTR